MTYLCIKDVAQLLGKSTRWVQNKCIEGDFPNAWKTTTTDSGHWQIPKSDVDEYVRRMLIITRTQINVKPRA